MKKDHSTLLFIAIAVAAAYMIGKAKKRTGSIIVDPVEHVGPVDDDGNAIDYSNAIAGMPYTITRKSLPLRGFRPIAS